MVVRCIRALRRACTPGAFPVAPRAPCCNITSMLARFFKAFLARYTCAIYRQFQATHGLLCVTCHLDDRLSLRAHPSR